MQHVTIVPNDCRLTCIHCECMLSLEGLQHVYTCMFRHEQGYSQFAHACIRRQLSCDVVSRAASESGSTPESRWLPEHAVVALSDAWPK